MSLECGQLNELYLSTMIQIREYLDNIAKLKDADWEIFSSKLIRQEFPKKTLLLKAGQTENYLSFIERGIIRFFIPKEDTDFTLSFSFANAFVSAYDSFLTQAPSNYHVETLTETVLWRLTYQDLQAIYAETEIGNTIGRNASEGLYLENFRREISLLTETAEQRYLKLFSERPELIEKIPLKYIASYIGITPQALSRIRRRIC